MRKFRSFFFLSLIVQLIIGCNNVIDFSLEDAEKHYWLKPFIDGCEYIEGKHNIDNNYIELTLRTEQQEYLNYTDSIAYQYQWLIGYSSGKSRVYIKNIPYTEGDENVFIIELTKVKHNLLSLKIIS